MTDQTAAIAHLDRQAVEADRMAARSPFPADRKRFADMADDYRVKALKLRG
jgi:hypothetical protein